MTWFPVTPTRTWDGMGLPPGTEQELEGLENILGDIPQPGNHNHAIESYSQDQNPWVDATTLDPHSLIAPPTNGSTGFAELMMYLDGPFAKPDRSQRMTAVQHAAQLPEQSANMKPILQAPKPQSHQKPLQKLPTTRFRCGWKGCKYNGTFGRKAELMRHIDALHVSPHSYDCPVQKCPKVFNRRDNLLEHIRRAHGI
ncbi:hypothetical protein BDV26DRAFT_2190 [Aspergillus bertholletiae]|uniref:C2H2-type domain-containing protein n=1 Tax=Aspergillus bertholletiae TaxID=1226010 RepID=A0A5N7BPV9_9EURO|nr:hypothetical protein BDV26DRAFT_2190 [Aspergillus bertholletiae]